MAEAYPSIDINIGPGSYAVYLGCEPVFKKDTVWYKACIKDYGSFNLNFDENNHWLNKHLDIIKKIHAGIGDKVMVNIPDIVENIDILAAMRDPQTLLYDMMDTPHIVKEYIDFIDSHYMHVYDKFYDIVKDQEDFSSFTAFHILGSRKTAKLQCDFSAMISPSHFREFVLPNLILQCDMLDNCMYHLDGPDCICQVEALMEIEGLNALQWTPGAGSPDGANHRWYDIYSKVRDAGKSIWVSINDGEFNDWVRSAKDFVNEFGTKGVYMIFPRMTLEQAEKMLDMSYGW